MRTPKKIMLTMLVLILTSLLLVSAASAIDVPPPTCDNYDGDMDLVWDAAEDRLRAKLNFPCGATQAKLMAYDVADDTLDYEVSPLYPAGSDNFLNYDWDVSGWELKSYTIKVKYMDDSDVKVGRWSTVFFHGLHLRAIEMQMDNIQTDIDVLTADVDANADAIDALQVEIDLIWDDLEDAWNDILALEGDVEDLQNDVEALGERLSDLEESVDDLWNRLDEMADFGLAYDQVGMELELDGSGAPQDAEWAKLFVETADGNYMEKVYVGVNGDGTFEYTFDVSDWNFESMNIFVTFYEGRYWKSSWFFGGYYKYTGRLDTIFDTWDGLLAELEYGFEHVAEKTWTAYNIGEPVEREIVYSIMPHGDGLGEWIFGGGLYHVELTLLSSETEEELSQTLEGCTWLEADIENNLISTVSVPAEGVYYVRLEAHKCIFASDFMTSNVFVIQLDDLQDDIAPELEALGARIDDLQTQIETNAEDIEALEKNVTAIWADLDAVWTEIEIIQGDIEELQEEVEELGIRLTILEESVDDLWNRMDQMGDFGLAFDQKKMELELDGSGAPQDAQWAKIFVETADGNDMEKVYVEVNEDGTFEYTFDVSEWNIEYMNIFVTFYEERVWKSSWFFGGYYKYKGRIDTIFDIFDGLLIELEYGFEHIAEKTWTAYYMVEPMERDIVYSVMPHVDGFLSEGLFGGGLYQITMTQIWSDTEEDISQVLEECTWLEADVENNLISTVSVPVPGTYSVRLEAHKGCIWDWGDYMFSNEFVIDLHDLKDSLPEAELIVVSPEPNKEEVFWTRSDESFTLVGMISLNGLVFDTTEIEAADCRMKYINANRYLSEYLPVSLDEEFATCSDELSMAGLDLSYGGLGEEGIYEIRLLSDIEPNEDPTDLLFIGVDDTKPEILEIFPGEEDSIRQIIVFSAEVIDEMSGVEFVDMSLYLKTGGLEWSHAASYVGDDMWEVELDTTEVPDGAYDITVEAWDYAGNYATETLDPIIDNTAPVIVEITLPDLFRTGVENLVSAHVTDNLAGVDHVTLYLTPWTCEIPPTSGPEPVEVTGLTDECIQCEGDLCFECGPSVTVIENWWCEAPEYCEHPIPFFVEEEGDGDQQVLGAPMVLVLEFDMDLTEGDSLDGIWTKDVMEAINEFNPGEGVWFTAVVAAVDSAKNGEMEMGNEAAAEVEQDVPLRQEFKLRITGMDLPTVAGGDVTVYGTLDTIPESSNLTGEFVRVNGVDAVVKVNKWQATLSSVRAQGMIVVAKYLSECNDTYETNAFATIATAAPAGGGGGGGGGGGSSIECESKWGCEEWGECQPDGTRLRDCAQGCADSQLINGKEWPVIIYGSSLPEDSDDCTYTDPTGGDGGDTGEGDGGVDLEGDTEGDDSTVEAVSSTTPTGLVTGDLEGEGSSIPAAAYVLLTLALAGLGVGLYFKKFR